MSAYCTCGASQHNSTTCHVHAVGFGELLAACTMRGGHLVVQLSEQWQQRVLLRLCVLLLGALFAPYVMLMCASAVFVSYLCRGEPRGAVGVRWQRHMLLRPWVLLLDALFAP